MDRTILITGATSGIGLALTEKLYGKNWKIYSVSRSEKKIEEAKKRFPDVTYLRGDVTDRSFLESAAERIKAESSRLDALVNGAGIIKKGGLEDMDFGQWDELMDVNLTSVFNVSKIMLPLLKESEGASIVNISSISSTMGGSCIGYCAAKAGVDRMTQFMARELAKYDIRVNSVNPGLIDTGFQVHNNTIAEDDFESHMEKMQELYPLGTGTAEDVADLIEFLISEKAKWISGANYLIDGARSTRN